MIAIILEESTHARQVLTKMLTVLGYDVVLSSPHIDEVCFFINQNLSRVKVILSSSTFEDGPDFPLSRLVIQNRELDLTPLIYIQNESHFYSQRKNKPNPLSRIDDSLTKPFILKDLKASIELAQQRRAELRNTVLVFGKPGLRENAMEAMYECGDSTHWKEVISASSFESLKETIAKNGFRVGTLWIESAFLTPGVVQWLRLFKRSALGAQTPVVFLSQSPEFALQVRPYCDLFIPDPETISGKQNLWKRLMVKTSRRLVYSWRLKDLLSSAREFIKSDEIKLAHKKIKEALSIDPFRWEVQELAGLLAEKAGKNEIAIENFKSELATQPFAPLPHIKLILLSFGDEKVKAIHAAALSCPQHPQIQEMLQLQSSKGGA